MERLRSKGNKKRNEKTDGNVRDDYGETGLWKGCVDVIPGTVKIQQKNVHRGLMREMTCEVYAVVLQLFYKYVYGVLATLH